MSYLHKTEYEVLPNDSFPIIYNCAGCGHKTRYKTTKNFRVNANGRKLDVWLIYQCEKCKHTLNLSIYERIKAEKILPEEYSLFLCNDEELANRYGMDIGFFLKNRIEIDWEGIGYKVVDMQGKQLIPSEKNYQAGDTIIINNPYGLRIRPEKLAAETFHMSRSQVRKMVDEHEVVIYKKAKIIEIEVCKA